MPSTHQSYLAEKIYLPFKIRNVVLVAKEAGVEPKDILQGTGLNSGDLNRLDCRTSLNQLARVYRNLKNLGAGDAIGLRVGQRLGPIQYGVYGIAISSSQTMGSGLDVVFSFGELEMPAVRMCLVVDNRRGHVHFVNTDNLGQFEIRQLNLEIHIAMCWNFTKTAVLEEFRPIEMWFDYPAPSYSSAYEDYFECPCRFDMPKNALIFPRAWLDMPLRDANPITKAIMVEECELALRELRGSRSISTQFFELMTRGGSEIFRTDDIASLLGMTNRQLRRMLLEEGTSPRKLLREFHLKEAISLFGQGSLSVSEISERLGYSDPAAFRTAFRSWTGLSCGEYMNMAYKRDDKSV
jgi:AraC-like DNA-binding protein